MLQFHFQSLVTSKPEEGWYGLASRNIVLNIQCCISLAVVFDLSSFYCQNSLKMACRVMPSSSHDKGKQNWNFQFCFLPMRGKSNSNFYFHFSFPHDFVQQNCNCHFVFSAFIFVRRNLSFDFRQLVSFSRSIQ